SDHHALRWVIDYGAEEVENVLGVKYNFEKTDPTEWKLALSRELQNHKGRWEVVQKLDQPRTAAELDEDVKILTDALKSATAQTTPERQPNARAVPYWSKKL
ncbi:MAG: hypothetical protein NXY57DRAFT_862762, partial [Lentinula lateritia]